MPKELALGEIARMVGGELVGDPGLRICGAAPLATASASEIAFADDLKRARDVARSHAGAFVVPRGMDLAGRPGIVVDAPRLAFAAILAAFQPETGMPKGIDERAWIDETAVVGRNPRIGPYATVGPLAVLGDDVTLYPGVRVEREARVGAGTVVHSNAVIGERVVIGRNVILHPGAVIGADGFGYVTSGGVHHKVPQIGTVVIEDDVEIGANSCVDRATMGATVIGRGTKIDNLVQIAHNVRVGANCIIVGMTAIGGSTEIGDGCVIAGGVGAKDHVRIGAGAIVGARSLVTTNVPAGVLVSGAPARPHKEQLSIEAALRKLPELAAQVRALEERVRELEGRLRLAQAQGRG